MAQYLAIPTLAGQAAIAAAIDPVSPVPLHISQFVVGDGNGIDAPPIETQTALVNQRAVVPISQSSLSENKLTIDAIFDQTIGGFTIREAGILDNNGVLLFVASIPPTAKVTAAENAFDILTVGIIVVVSDTAQVVLTVDGLTYATHDYVNQALLNLRTTIATPLRPYHIAVKSMTIATPPASPAPGDTYIVAADATGAWAGQAGKLTQYAGSSVWLFVTCPSGHFVGDEATGLLFQKIGNVWAAYMPANAVGWLYNNGNGVKTWSDPFNIAALTTREIADDDLMAHHDVSAGLKGKNTVAAYAAKFADNDFELKFFLGTM